MAKSPYDGKSLPELFLVASQKGIKDFFRKNEKEMVKYLDEWDATHNQVTPSKSQLKTKEGFKNCDVIDDDLDELIDLDDLDADDVVVSPNQNSHREKNCEADPPVEDIVVDDDSDGLLDDIDDDIDDDDIAQTPIPKRKVSNMAKKPATTKNSASKNEAPKNEAPKNEAPKNVAPKKAPANKTEGMSPYSTSAAGHYVYIALKKGGSMETIVKNSDTLIAKFEVRPPSNTAGKVKIIMSEINKGKRDDKWGRFLLNEKTKKISWSSEV